MKTHSEQQKQPSRQFRLLTAISLISISLMPTVFAASQTWTNAPADNTWTNILNWNGQAVPGADNMFGNSTVADIASFTNPIPASLIGSATRPVMIDDATIVTTTNRSRQIGGMIFDTANCGAYVFSGTTPAVYPGTGILYVTYNDNIVMNAPVPNSQTFLLPVLIRLPSSTAGLFSIINNSTNPSAVFNFNSITNDSATSRGTIFTLSGSNTGTNTIGTLSEGISLNSVGAAAGLTKSGTGTWILAGANTFTNNSAMNINQGRLIVQNAAGFGVASSVSVNSNGVVQVDNVSLTTPNFNLNGNGTIQMSGTGTITKVTVGTAAGISATFATTTASDVMTVGAAANDVTGGAVGSVLNIAGPGMVVLDYANNYAGTWSLNAGTLQLAAGVTGALGTGADVNIGPGAIFDVSLVTAGSGSYNPGTAAIGGSGTGTVVGSTAATIKADPSGFVNLATGSKGIVLTYNPISFNGDSSHPALYISQGTLSLGDNAFSINNASGTPLGAGTYQLILQASGTITSAGGYSVTGVTGSGLAAGDVANVVVNGSEVDLVVTAYVPQTLTWLGGNPNSNWDLSTTANFQDGGIASVFNNSDNVTFNSVGAANPGVDLTATLAPGSVTVNTSANNYTFTGSGQIAGSTSLVKVGTGTLSLQTVNSYAGGTTVSNGVLQVGIINAVPDTGAGNVTIQSSGTLDLNTYNDTINALVGSGTVDTVAGGSPVLTIGNNNNSGTFAGIIQNTSGTLGLTQNGSGVETLTGINTYTGATTINAGTLRIGNSLSLPNGNAVTINNGTLDLAANVTVGTLAGAGTVANNATTVTNTLAVAASSTFNGVIADGSGGGGVSLLVSNGVLVLNGVNTYSGGTILASGTTLNVGTGPAQAGTGGILASNNATIYAASASSASTTIGNNITTVDNALVSLTSGETADAFNGQFYGSALATNMFYGNGSIGGTLSFSNFLGTAIFTNAEMRLFNATCGGDNTTFILTGGGGLFTRDADTVHLGALFGDGIISNPSVTPPGTYWIGAKGIDSMFSGSISGSNNIVKTGADTLTLNIGSSLTTNIVQDGLFITTNIAFGTNTLTYTGNTTISNGVLQLVAQASLTNSPVITLAAPTAVLDASQIAYLDDTGTNLVTNSLFEIVSGETLNGKGSIYGYLQADPGSILNPGDIGGVLTNGMDTGVLTVSSNVTLNGTLNLRINNTNSVISDELAAPGYTISGATLVITNVGPALAGGNVFHLFSSGINTNGFTSIVLPTVASPLILSNNLAFNGTLVIVSTVNSNPTNIVYSVSNNGSANVLSLSWPVDHTGWYLQMQTNSLSTGLSTNWVDVPGSSAINSTNIVVDPTKPTVFYRLSLQP